MNETRLGTIEQIREFLAGTADVVFTTPDDQEALHQFIAMVLKRHGYFELGKGQRGVLFNYMLRLTGYTRQHLTKLVARYRQDRHLLPVTRASRTSFSTRFGPADVALLAELDSLHNTLSGPATKVLLRRAWQSFGDERYALLASISVSHLYNLRASTGYKKHRMVWSRTRPTPVKIGIRKAPAPCGLPGYIRIDTVHQGDQDGLKGVYHVNAVDIVTQWEVVASVERISEAFLLPVIALMLESFPFTVLGFHSDNGSEYVNQDVSRMLNKLNVEFTKSRPRHSNDNALAESKNGSVIRKTMGYAHIPQKHAAVINEFYAEALNPYLNFHRPCYFAVDTVDAKGKVKKTYPQDQVMTPYERLKSLPEYTKTLRPGMTAELLQKLSVALSDNDAARHVQEVSCEALPDVQPSIQGCRLTQNHFRRILRLENTEL